MCDYVLHIIKIRLFSWERASSPINVRSLIGKAPDSKSGEGIPHCGFESCRTCFLEETSFILISN